MSTISLFLGLGNPGPNYAKTRHNFGFFLADALVALCQQKGSCTSLSGKGFFEGYKCTLPGSTSSWIVAKPMTFMNKSGETAVHLLHYYRIPPDQLFVAHDELDLPLGRMRIKIGGGAAGHNGIRSICDLTGTSDFYRLRLGIGKPRSGNSASYVLDNFPSSEMPRVETVTIAALHGFLLFASQGFPAARQTINAFALPDEPVMAAPPPQSPIR